MTTAEEKQEIRRRDYKHLLTKYKNVEEANDFFKLQLQDLHARLKIEHNDKERLRQELHKARAEITSKPNAHGVEHGSDIEVLNNRLKEAFKKVEEEFELREQVNKDLEYTKAMLMAEGKTRMLLENRNSVLEQELKSLGAARSGEGSVHIQLEETKKRLEEEIKTRQKLQAAKETLEAELEDLTKSLFEEANTMVSKEAREKFELMQTKKRLEQELELAKNKILLDEKLLTTMKTKFTTLEMKAKKMHRRTGSATTASTLSTSPIPPGVLVPTPSQMRTTSSHPNLLTLKDEVETRQRSKSSSLLNHGIPQSVSLPSSPVTQHDPSPLTSPIQHSAGGTTPPNTSGIILQVLSPSPTPAHPHPSSKITNPTLTIAESKNSSTSHPNPTSTPNSLPNSTEDANHTVSSNANTSKSPPIQIPSNLAHNPANPLAESPTNPLSVSPANSTSTSHAFHDLHTSATTNAGSSDDTMSEVSHNDNSSVADGEDWDIDWLLEDVEERKEDDSVLFTELEGRIDLQGGLSQFVQFLSTAKQDWACRYMDRVLRDDVAPCLRLRTQEDRAYRKLLEAVFHNRIFVEHLTTPVNEVCAGCGAENTCQWRVRVGSSHDFKNMGDMCRERIVRSCDFYMYLRNLRQGLVKKTLPNIYKEFLRLRLMMNFARLCAG